jgi:hypothetical protein
LDFDGGEKKSSFTLIMAFKIINFCVNGFHSVIVVPLKFFFHLKIDGGKNRCELGKKNLFRIDFKFLCGFLCSLKPSMSLAICLGYFLSVFEP